ncbi:response regulator receiver domain-containing protein [Rhizobium azibense]|uniref:Response regulator receiver domain-containing protein n=1 Tax=Rhizobium azibense TaxID=1136135 RepID=A0A4V2VAP4_9HYPH|nr:response regulator [Rhizobium azibense]TCU21775.1 response regulator receiver domain-containing protein [Rhizobium azibense]TCU33385.1 response regulator receiver domain-containing protein [Rhizobium azibense]
MDPVTILLVDDEASVLNVFEDALADAGFEVRTVADGRKAIQYLAAADPPVQGLITDIRLGDGPDGWEVARAAREIEPLMPVVYTSGDSAADWASKGVPNSIMLQKPFALAQLVTAISQLLNESSMAVPDRGDAENGK